MLTAYTSEKARDLAMISIYQAKHLTLQQLGDLFNLSRQRVHQVLQNYNVPRKPRVLSETKERAIDLFLSGMSIEAVAKEIDLGVESTRMILKRAEVSRKDGTFLSKYPSDVRDGIYTAYRAGMSTLEIARKLDMPQSTVYSLLKKAGMIKVS